VERVEEQQQQTNKQQTTNNNKKTKIRGPVSERLLSPGFQGSKEV
jgi:hypothetical protein